MARARRPIGAAVVVLTALAVTIATGTAGEVSAATGGWTIAWAPSAIAAGVPTNIALTATNISGGSSLGCVRLQLPGAFGVGVVAVDAVQPAHAWTADPPFAGSAGSTIVQVHAQTEGDILKGDGDTVAFHLAVTGTAPGTYVWPAESRDHANCTSGIDTDSVTISVFGPTSKPTPTPRPTPTPTPRPTPTPTPRPTPTPAPTPTPTPTPTQRATPPPSPTPAPTSPPGHTSPPSSVGPASPTPGSLPSITPSSAAPTAPAPTPAASADAGLPPIAGSGDGNAGGGSNGLPPDDVGQRPFAVANTSAATVFDPALTISTLTRLDGIVWAVPTLALTVPGVLLVLAVMAQIAAGAAWMPIVRRKLGGAIAHASKRRPDQDRRA
jgi:hypothetical protein